MKRFSQLICFVTVVASLAMPRNGSAQTVTCQDVSTRVNAVALPGNHNITTKFQLDTPSLQVLMRTRIVVQGTTPSCVVADLSALTRITDNYVVYQLRIDGVPMEGQTGGWAGVPDPVIIAPFDDADEQLVDPFRIVSHTFFKKVSPGPHLIEVMVAGGSNIIPGFEPQVVSPVLTVRYR